MKKYFLVSKIPRKSRFDFLSCFSVSGPEREGEEGDGWGKCLGDLPELCIELDPGPGRTEATDTREAETRPGACKVSKYSSK